MKYWIIFILFYSTAFLTHYILEFFIFKSFRPLKTAVQEIESLYFFWDIFSQRPFLTFTYDDPVAPLSFRKM